MQHIVLLNFIYDSNNVYGVRKYDKKCRSMFIIIEKRTNNYETPSSTRRSIFLFRVL